MLATPAQTPTAETRSGCPFTGGALPKSLRKSGPVPVSADTPVTIDPSGIWHVESYPLGRDILRSEKTVQAGFGSELMDQLPNTMKPPILFLNGKPHQEQRRQTARFFTPRATDARYRDFMENCADEVVAELRRAGRGDLSALGMKMAVQVASQVVGLTHSLWPGMDRRIDRLVHQDLTPRQLSLWQKGALFVQTQSKVLPFLLLDVRPAVQARKKERREDVISHLLDSEYGLMEILTECITYGAAGMVTTREFISLVAWHCLEHPEYRELMVSADQETRYAFLHELLRAEPIVSHLLRRATEEIVLEVDGETFTIPAGTLLDLNIILTNADETVVGADPFHICPGRELHQPEGSRAKVPPQLLSFGDGAHRCPGAYIAIQESDIFLRKLLALPGLRIERAPDVEWNETVKGYEIRNFILALS